MGRRPGSKDKAPRAKRGTAAKKPTVSTATRRAMDKASADSNNGVNIDAIKKLVATYFKQEDVLETFQGEYMNRCKGPRGIQKKAFEEAKIVGVPIRAVKHVIDLMKADRKKEKIRRKIENDDAPLVRDIQRELGQLADLPLGQAALEREADKEWEAAGAKAANLVASIADSNVTRLSDAAQKIQAGIRQLPADVDFEYDGGDAA